MEATDTPSTPAQPIKRAPRLWKGITWAASVLLVIVVVGFVLWARPMPADSGPLQAAYNTQGVSIGDKDSYLAVTRSDASIGFVFYPGARVAPEAYLAKLVPVVRAAPVNVYIARMPLSLAIFKVNAADDIIAANPSITKWYVGGHSLGGAMACRYADSHANKLVGVVLEASYCDQDITQSKLAVLQIVGDKDPLVTEDKLQKWDKNLPSDVQKEVIAGGNHAEFGDYGMQSGDGVATLDNQEFGRQLQDILGGFFNSSASLCADCVQTGTSVNPSPEAQ